MNSGHDEYQKRTTELAKVNEGRGRGYCESSAVKYWQLFTLQALPPDRDWSAEENKKPSLLGWLSGGADGSSAT